MAVPVPLAVVAPSTEEMHSLPDAGAERAKLVELLRLLVDAPEACQWGRRRLLSRIEEAVRHCRSTVTQSPKCRPPR